MTDIEISKALALAIGWRLDQLSYGQVSLDKGITWNVCCITARNDGDKHGRPFWYTDWEVIGPIAARYDAFPCLAFESEEWEAYSSVLHAHAPTFADTPQKAIALAVIAAMKK